MKFIKPSGKEFELTERLSFVDKKVSPFKEILSRKDFSKYSFVDEEKITLDAVTQIQVNILDVGTMIYIFKTEGFNKDQFIEEVSKLKEMKVESESDASKKIKALFDIAEINKPLFAIYNPNGKSLISEDSFKVIKTDIKTIYISHSDNAIKPEELGQKEIIEEPEEDTSFKFSNPFPIIAKEKFHYVFTLIATLLLGFTSSIGIYDAYGGKMICIFFFICSLAGAFLNFMIYKDTLKAHRFKSMEMILTAVFSIFGIGLSVAFYFLFKHITTEKPVIEPKLFLVLGVMVLIYLLSASIPLLIKVIKQKRKK